MNKIFILLCFFINFISGFISMHAILWLAISIYSVNCLINGCSDMVGDEWIGINAGLIIGVSIMVVLVPVMIVANLKFLGVTRMRKKYYILFIITASILGFILSYYLRTHNISPF